MADDDTRAEKPRMTPLEDAELRQLTWFGIAGDLSDGSRDRVAELRAKDRRAGVRDPRPDPISRDGDGRSYIRTTSGSEPQPDGEPDSEVRIRCVNCGGYATAAESICPHCRVRGTLS